MNSPLSIKINQAFCNAEEEFGYDKSTEFLCAIVGDRLGIDYDAVIAGLSEAALEDQP